MQPYTVPSTPPCDSHFVGHLVALSPLKVGFGMGHVQSFLVENVSVAPLLPLDRQIFAFLLCVEKAFP